MANVRMIAIRLAAAVLLALTSVAVPARAGEHEEHFEYGRALFISQLRERRFSDLNSLVAKLQFDGWRGERPFHHFYEALAAFEYADPALEPLFEEWVEQFPDSFVARAARGVYYSHLGSIARGERYASDVSDAQFETMSMYFSRAIEDFDAAVELNPDLTPAYWRLVYMHYALGRPEMALVAIERALDEASDFYPVYWEYLHKRSPWWGGSEDAMFYFVDRMADRFDDDPRFARTPSLEFYLQGLIAYWREGAEQALALFSQAVEANPEHPFYRRHRGEHLMEMGRYDEAHADLEMVTQAYATSPDFINQLGVLHTGLQNLDKARLLTRIAMLEDPYNPYFVIDFAKALMVSGRDIEAVALFDRAMVYGESNPWIHNSIGRLMWRASGIAFPGWPGQSEVAYSAFERALALLPLNETLWRHYINAFFAYKDCRVHMAIDSYRAMCKSTGHCELDPDALLDRTTYLQCEM